MSGGDRARAGKTKGGKMNREIEERMRLTNEFFPGLPDPDAAAMGPADPEYTPLRPGAGGAARIPLELLRRLKLSLESHAGRRGARLAEMALRAGFKPPARKMEIPASVEALQSTIWMALVRENAELRRQAASLRLRKTHLNRSIRRARSRIQALRIKMLQRQLGLTPESLLSMPLPGAWRLPDAGRLPQGGTREAEPSAAGEGIEPPDTTD